MYHLQRNATTGAPRLTATGATPAALLEAALRGVLDAARGGPAPSSPDTAVAVPVRGAGANLGDLFIDLARDLIGQLEEFGPGLDDLRLDGLLRTDNGGYTAWGYLSGPAGGASQQLLTLSVGDPEIVEVAGEMRLVCELRIDQGGF